MIKLNPLVDLLSDFSSSDVPSCCSPKPVQYLKTGLLLTATLQKQVWRHVVQLSHFRLGKNAVAVVVVHVEVVAVGVVFFFIVVDDDDNVDVTVVDVVAVNVENVNDIAVAVVVDAFVDVVASVNAVESAR